LSNQATVAFPEQGRKNTIVQLNTQSLEMKTPKATKVLVIGGAEDKVHGREILFLLVLDLMLT